MNVTSVVQAALHEREVEGLRAESERGRSRQSQESSLAALQNSVRRVCTWLLHNLWYSSLCPYRRKMKSLRRFRMARNAFFSFHFDLDHWRASQVRNMGILEGNSELSDNDWEAVKRGGDASIQKWIDGQMAGRSCVVVLVGAQTATRKWVMYEIRKGWELGKGVVGIRIHGLLNRNSQTCIAGPDPFVHVTIPGGRPMSSIVGLWNPAGGDSKAVYANIRDNVDRHVASAITARASYRG
jgi:hypothetical protein